MLAFVERKLSKGYLGAVAWYCFVQVYSLEQFFGGRLGILNKNYLAIFLNFLDLLKLEMKYCEMFMEVAIYEKGDP